MRKWIVAITTISAALLMSCGDESSNSSPTYPGDTEKEIDDNFSSSGKNHSKSSSSQKGSSKQSGNSSSSSKKNSSSESGKSSVRASNDTSSYLSSLPTERKFSYIIETTEMKLDLKTLTVTDKRDGQVYDVEWQDSTVRMVQYLNYEIKDKSWCYNDYAKNCQRFGRLYSLRGAFCPAHDYTNISPQGPCPLGWEVNNVVSPLGAPGYIVDEVFAKLGRDGKPWASFSTKDNCNEADFLHQAFAVRCRYHWYVSAPDSITKPTPKEFKAYQVPEDLPTYSGPYGELVDVRDGNVYRTVDIGKQTWMAENLRFRTDGSYAPTAMGRLYTWSIATGMDYYNRDKSPTPYQGVCPMGWHIPTKTDWRELFDFVLEKTDGVFIARPLKSTDGWETPETAGTNSFGFNVVPADGKYVSSGLTKYTSNTGPYYNMYFIVADDRLTGTAWFIKFPKAEADAEPRLIKMYDDYKYYGYVRCIKGVGTRTIIFPEEDKPVTETPSEPTSSSSSATKSDESSASN